MKADNILATIGHTPHIRINRLFGAGAQVWIKSERANPGGSIKDRLGRLLTTTGIAIQITPARCIQR